MAATIFAACPTKAGKYATILAGTNAIGNARNCKLLQPGISEPEYYWDLVYRIRKIVGKSNFSEQFKKLINRYKRMGYNPYVMRQTACLVINPTSVDGYASLFNCTPAGWASNNHCCHLLSYNY